MSPRFFWPIVVVVGAAVVVAGWRFASTPAVTAHITVDTTAGLGMVVDDFSFTDIDGENRTLGAYAERKPVVIAMRDALCPVSRRYGPVTARLAGEFARRGVKFLYVNVSPLDTQTQMLEDRSRYGLTGAYTHDPQWVIARVLRVITTGEVFLLDSQRRLVYRGAIDDQYGIRFTRPEPRTHFLRDATERLLAGQTIERPATLPEGCYLATDVRQIDHHGHEPAR